MNDNNDRNYLRYLPAIYQIEKDGFLERFLKVFENILSKYSLFRVEIKDPAGLAYKLLDANNPLSVFIKDRFSQENRRILDEFMNASQPSEALQKALNEEFKNLLLGNSIYEKNRFQRIKLSPETAELLEKNPVGNDLIRLNMMLLVEAFPYEVTQRKGIEEIIDQIHIYFEPLNMPLEFLPWLAGWMALVPREEDEWNENNAAKKRDLIAKIIPLYQRRGTLDGLRKFIRIYVGEDVKISINEFLETLQIGVSSTIGTNTAIREGRPYYFQVYIELPTASREILEKRRRVIRNIINLEKPAHTYYYLITEAPTMQIGVHSKIGVDTLLGSLIRESTEA
ncbi:MAG: phage tail protein [Candidatus Methanoperedens sp.]|nr:phage tail protein [Candidatus Methanoperedens sp.]MCZ7371672.1 phage tail protein [Candidatus Methanoperedens sp.]